MHPLWAMVSQITSHWMLRTMHTSYEITSMTLEYQVVQAGKNTAGIAFNINLTCIRHLDNSIVPMWWFGPTDIVVEDWTVAKQDLVIGNKVTFGWRPTRSATFPTTACFHQYRWLMYHSSISITRRILFVNIPVPATALTARRTSLLVLSGNKSASKDGFFGPKRLDASMEYNISQSTFSLLDGVFNSFLLGFSYSTILRPLTNRVGIVHWLYHSP